MKTKFNLFIIFFFTLITTKNIFSQSLPTPGNLNPGNLDRRSMLQPNIPNGPRNESNSSSDNVLAELNKVIDTNFKGSSNTEKIIAPISHISSPEIKFVIWFLRTSGVLDIDYRVRNLELISQYPDLAHNRRELAKKIIDDTAKNLMYVAAGTSVLAQIIVSKLAFKGLIGTSAAIITEGMNIIVDCYLFYLMQTKMLFQIADLFEYPIIDSDRLIEALGIISASISLSAIGNIGKNAIEAGIRKNLLKNLSELIANSIYELPKELIANEVANKINKVISKKVLSIFVQKSVSGLFLGIGIAAFSYYNYWATQLVGNIAISSWSDKLELFKTKSVQYLSRGDIQYAFFDIITYIANADGKISDKERKLFLAYLTIFNFPKNQLAGFAYNFQKNILTVNPVDVKTAAKHFKSAPYSIRSYLADQIFLLIYFDDDAPITESRRAKEVFQAVGFDVQTENNELYILDSGLIITEIMVQELLAAISSGKYQWEGGLLEDLNISIDQETIKIYNNLSIE
jgi:hypothetical protein